MLPGNGLQPAFGLHSLISCQGLPTSLSHSVWYSCAHLLPVGHLRQPPAYGVGLVITFTNFFVLNDYSDKVLPNAALFVLELL